MTQNWNDEAHYDDYYETAPERSWSTLALILAGLAGILIGFACAACVGGAGLALFLLPADTSSQAPEPTAILAAPVEPQPVNPAPAPVAPALPSGGLGLSQPEWEQLYGPGAPSDRPGFLWYQGGIYLVGFQDGSVSYIERQWPPESGITVDEARRQSGELSPFDRQYIQAYSPEGRPDLVVDLYMSPWLAGRFGGGWVNGQPGNFTATFTLVQPNVTRMVISLGNNPF
jgi:hypothetical protein